MELRRQSFPEVRRQIIVPDEERLSDQAVLLTT